MSNLVWYVNTTGTSSRSRSARAITVDITGQWVWMICGEKIGQRIHCSGTEGIPCPVTYDLGGIKAGIAYDGKRIVIRRTGIIRNAYHRAAKLILYHAGIIQDSIGHTIYDRRKRIV